MNERLESFQENFVLTQRRTEISDVKNEIKECKIGKENVNEDAVALRRRHKNLKK